ncbi:MAG TPA: hypothetical protein VFN72_12215, partial [Solirubrobacterales bacterium]|nr:hypothetical protein [Solirubrobacterales bacterium]
MFSRRLLPLAALLLLCGAPAAPAAASACGNPAFDPADEPPFGGQILKLSAALPPSTTPAGFEL